MGVWSVTVKGLMSRMERSLRGRGLSAGSEGACWVKYTLEFSKMPSCFRRAFSIKIHRKKTKVKFLIFEKNMIYFNVFLLPYL